MIAFRIVLVGFLFSILSLASGAVPPAGFAPYDAYFGSYQIGPGHEIGISRFIMDSGAPVVLMSDYRSGAVRRLFPVSQNEFEMGPGFDQASPAELRVRFERNAGGQVTGLTLQPAGGSPSFARRAPLEERSVTIDANGRATLVEFSLLHADQAITSPDGASRQAGTIPRD